MDDRWFDADIDDTEDQRDQNPYTALEGYTLEDASGARVGRVEETIYDAVSDVLKYVIADGHTIPADRIQVDAENECVRAPYSRDLIESAPDLEDVSGVSDQALRAHYGET